MKNAVGRARYVDERTGRAYWVPYGLLPGSPDLVGIRRVWIPGCSHHRPIKLGVLFCLETKQVGGRLTAEQRHCHEVWRDFGAFVSTVRGPDEGRAAYERACRGEFA
ncbi:hypothetical protein LZC95_07745 [Pendulispora brunnea]|uniref:VRR-NUC domain-containing protein n=1 Tax=Pendulispora brunnea TaxID=2905690 RepID=A0ABZ2KGQ9_9BACT